MNPDVAVISFTMLASTKIPTIMLYIYFIYVIYYVKIFILDGIQLTAIHCKKQKLLLYRSSGDDIAVLKRARR